MLSRLVGAIVVGVFMVAGLGSYANAFEEPIPTKIGLLKWGGNPVVGNLCKIVSKAPKGGPVFQLPSASPATTGGSLTVTMGRGTLGCTLAPGLFNGTVGWKELGNPAGSKGYKYLNKTAPTTDPCKIVIIKKKVIKVLAKGLGDINQSTPPNLDVSTSLTVGNDRYCAQARSLHYKETSKLIKMKEQDQPDQCRFVDNGDGTITDRDTALMWEKKDSDDATPNPANLHDVDNGYGWAGCCDGICPTLDDYCQPNAAAAAACFAQTGGAVGCSECSVGTCETWGYGTIWEWIVQVNAEGGSGFAGHGDWRIPSQEGCNTCYTGSPSYNCPCDPAELESILLEPYPCGTSPCIDAIFGPTLSTDYGTSTTSASSPGSAWGVFFFNGLVGYGDKGYVIRVRGVRGGLPSSPSGAFLDATTGVLD